MTSFIQRPSRLLVPSTFSDDFNRANGGLGSNWTTVNTALQIVSNAVQGPTQQLTYIGVWATPVAVDCFSQADVTLGGTGNYNEGGVIVRGQTTEDGYILYWNTSNSGSYEIYKITSASYSLLAATGGVGTTGTRTMRLEVVGSALTGKANGSTVVSTTDTTYTTQTRIGIETYYEPGASSPTLDNWVGGSL